MQHPFVCPLIGSIGSGKTTTLVNLLSSTDFYKQKFHRLIYISCSADLDEKQQRILQDKQICISNQRLMDAYDDKMYEFDEYHEKTKLPKFHGIENEDIHDYYSPDIMESLMKHQKSVIKEFGRDLSDLVLVAVEDGITSGAFSKGIQTAFARMACCARLYNISIVYVSQQWKAVPKVIRTQSTAGIFCGQLNETEMKDVYEKFSCGMPYYKWCEIFSVIVNKPFQPVVFNLKNRRSCKMQKAFQEYAG
jgi:hypothetical protein